MRLVPLLALLLAGTTAAEAPAPPRAEPLPPPPMATPPEAAPPEAAPPAEGSSAEVIEPQVTIQRRGSDVIEEYRVGGQLYMVKIIPAKGYPYFLVDTDGDGSLETRRGDLANPEIPQWVLFRW